MRYIIFSIAAIFTLSTPGFSSTYDLVPERTSIGFSVRHMVFSKVKGNFDKFSGAIKMDEGRKLAQFSAVVDMDSVNTESEKRDSFLRSDKFLNVKKYPTMTFVSTKIEADGNKYIAEGALTIKDITKPVKLTGKMLGVEADPHGNQRVSFKANFLIKRSDYDLGFGKVLEVGELIVGDEVSVALDVEGILVKEQSSLLVESKYME